VAATALELQHEAGQALRIEFLLGGAAEALADLAVLAIEAAQVATGQEDRAGAGAAGAWAAGACAAGADVAGADAAGSGCWAACAGSRKGTVMIL
jgi:hypothetical protein